MGPVNTRVRTRVSMVMAWCVVNSMRSCSDGKLLQAFEEVKDSFDPKGLFNPGKIVHPLRMDDPSLFRYKPGYQAIPVTTGLNWDEWGGFDQAIEMCNNNGACRKTNPGVMCPSYRVTQDEQHVTRGRANSLRLALTGQLGPRRTYIKIFTLSHGIVCWL